ncbi:hypothetical protein BJ546DRAFT_676337 [Cryomyces antarcticus]
MVDVGLFFYMFQSLDDTIGGARSRIRRMLAKRKPHSPCSAFSSRSLHPGSASFTRNARKPSHAAPEPERRFGSRKTWQNERSYRTRLLVFCATKARRRNATVGGKETGARQEVAGERERRWRGPWVPSSACSPAYRGDVGWGRGEVCTSEGVRHALHSAAQDAVRKRQRRRHASCEMLNRIHRRTRHVDVRGSQPQGHWASRQDGEEEVRIGTA